MAPECVEMYLRLNLEFFSREFESIETSSGLAQLQEENWNQSHKKITNQDKVRKNLSNDRSLQVYIVISRKKFNCTISDKKNDKKQNEWKSWELTVCSHHFEPS